VKTIVHVDFESRSELEFANDKSVGLHNYVTSPKTDPCVLAWAPDDIIPSLWEILRGESIPVILKEAALDPDVLFAAWNSPFERYFFKHKLGFDIPYSRWVDPQVSARYLSLPDDLETAGLVMNLPPEMLKDEEGHRLIKMFSKLTIPRKVRAKKDQIVVQPQPYFRDWNTDPEDWEKFGRYCCQDVVTERELMRRFRAFGVFPIPEREHRLWLLDQKINDRGMPTSRKFLANSSAIGIQAKQEALGKQKALTGVENPNSRDQLLAWAKTHGYPLNNLRKEPVRAALEDPDVHLAPLVRQVLEARTVSASTSYKKLETMQRHLSSDDRLRNQFIFMGSSRAGRWSSGASQLHNMARPLEPFDQDEVLEEVRELIYENNYEALKDIKYSPKGDQPGEPLLAVKSSIRSAFEAHDGKRLNVADLKSIETCVCAWLAGCESLLAVCRDPDGDAYLDLASDMQGIPYPVLLVGYRQKEDKKLKALYKFFRQLAKPGLLGCVYRLSAGQWGIDRKTGDRTRTGLWGYSWNMGVKMTQEQAQLTVKTFRKKYVEIVQLWYDFEKAVEIVLKKDARRDATAAVGPNGCVWFDKLHRKGQNPVLRMHLPSGRCLHYIDARIEPTLMPWKCKALAEDGRTVIESDVYKPALVYSGVNQDTKQWESHVTSHGGKLTENAVQAIARDILAEGMLRADDAEFDIVGSVHDEIITETYDDGFDPDYKVLEHLMSLPIAWCPGMPLGADGYSGPYYKKG
jgi:DNA polymerase